MCAVSATPRVAASCIRRSAIEFDHILFPMRLLLVEDDTMIGEAIRAGLKRDGFTVDWVHDGERPRRCCGRKPSTCCCSTWACRARAASRSSRRPRARARAAGPHHHRARCGLRPRAGPGCRRRRLSGQALRPRGARGAHPRAAAAQLRAHGSGHRAPRGRLESGHARVTREGPEVGALAARVRAAAAAHGAARERSCRARSSRSASTAGARKSRATRSRCTSTGCAGSSAPIHS